MHTCKCKDLPYTESSPASVIPDGKDWTLKGNLHLHCWLLTCQGFWKPVDLGLFMWCGGSSQMECSWETFGQPHIFLVCPQRQEPMLQAWHPRWSHSRCSPSYEISPVIVHLGELDIAEVAPRLGPTFSLFCEHICGRFLSLSAWLPKDVTSHGEFCAGFPHVWDGGLNLTKVSRWISCRC